MIVWTLKQRAREIRIWRSLLLSRLCWGSRLLIERRSRRLHLYCRRAIWNNNEAVVPSCCVFVCACSLCFVCCMLTINPCGTTCSWALSSKKISLRVDWCAKTCLKAKGICSAFKSSDSPCCCCYLYLFCAYMSFVVCLRLAGLDLLFSLFSLFSCTHTFSHIQSNTLYLFVMQMLAVWDGVQD